MLNKTTTTLMFVSAAAALCIITLAGPARVSGRLAAQSQRRLSVSAEFRSLPLDRPNAFDFPIGKKARNQERQG